jgi:hypothetical protein
VISFEQRRFQKLFQGTVLWGREDLASEFHIMNISTFADNRGVHQWRNYWGKPWFLQLLSLHPVVKLIRATLGFFGP